MHGCDIMNIHGQCSHFYCDKCMKTNVVVEALDDSCENWNKFNPYEYRGYIKEMKECKK